jgi:hypothetical protein
MSTWLRPAAAVLLAAALAGCVARTQTASVPVVVSPAPVVHDLRTVADLATVFDRDRAHPRIVLLLSPT